MFPNAQLEILHHPHGHKQDVGFAWWHSKSFEGFQSFGITAQSYLTAPAQQHLHPICVQSMFPSPQPVGHWDFS